MFYDQQIISSSLGIVWLVKQGLHSGGKWLKSASYALPPAQVKFVVAAYSICCYLSVPFYGDRGLQGMWRTTALEGDPARSGTMVKPTQLFRTTPPSSSVPATHR